jgi:hypothetical protein
MCESVTARSVPGSVARPQRQIWLIDELVEVGVHMVRIVVVGTAARDC